MWLGGLVGLLRRSSTVDILIDISGRVELPGAALDPIPDLASDWGCALGANEVVDAGLELAERVLHVCALGETGPEEGGIEGDKDPRAAREENGAEEQADPEENLEPRDDRHRSIIVLLDKSPNCLGERVLCVLGLRARGSSCGRGDLLGRDEGRDNVGARVSRDVKDGVDSVWEEGEGVLRHE